MLAHPLLSDEAEAGRGRRIRQGDEEALHELVRHNLRLAWAFVKRYVGSREVYGEPEDLFAQGVLGLYKATRRFDPTVGRFSKYAVFYLRDALRTRRRYEGNRWFAPTKERAMPAEVAWRWLEKTGREADDELIAAELGWSQRRLHSTLGRARLLSLDFSMGEDGATLAERIPDERIDDADVQAERNDLIACGSPGAGAARSGVASGHRAAVQGGRFGRSDSDKGSRKGSARQGRRAGGAGAASLPSRWGHGGDNGRGSHDGVTGRGGREGQTAVATIYGRTRTKHAQKSLPRNQLLQLSV